MRPNAEGETAAPRALVEVESLSFGYAVDGRRVEVLKDVSFRIQRGDYVAIQGPSGSGKSTLFYILGLMLKGDKGIVRLDGQNLQEVSDPQAAWIRNRKIGFVFQQFHLLPRASVLDNILLPASYPAELPSERAAKRAKAILLAERLGLKDHLQHRPSQLSGGQQQRVAIARALLNDVDLILADEPTGNLDSRNAKEIMEIFADLNAQGKTIVIITHDPEVAAAARSTLRVRDGELVASADLAYTPVGGEAPPRSGWRAARAKLPKGWSGGTVGLALRALPGAVANLLRNRTKSLLTMLGVIVGIAAVLAMISLGQFARRRIVEGFEAMGVNKLVIRGYPNWDREATDVIDLEFQGFNADTDLKPLKRLFPEIKLLSPVLMNFQNTITAGGLTVNEDVRVLGVNQYYLTITNSQLTEGRPFTPYHVEKQNAVCILGSDVAQKVLPNVPKIGAMITVTLEKQQSFACQVIGVLAPKKSTQEWSKPNMEVLLPYTLFQSVAPWWASHISQVSFQVRSEQDVEPAATKVKNYFRQKYGASARIIVDTEGTLVAQTKRFLNIFALLLAAIAFLSLFVGGIGIHNMMLVSVSERVKEIGLRKALGATRASLKTQILMESLVLCGVAGLIGILFGIAATAAMILVASRFIPNLPFEWLIDPWAVAISTLSIVVVGMLSGSVPARRAERLQIIEALRAE